MSTVLGEIAHAAPRRRWFFPATAALLILVVAAGFAPTFYLRGLGTGELPPGLRVLPGYIYAHGAALTAWFLLYITQTLLLASHRPDLHRRLGAAGGFVAAAVVVTTVVTVQQAIVTPVRAALIDVPVVFFFNVLGLIQFAALVGCALRCRTRPDVHKRLMFLANVPLVAAAVSRLPLELPALVAANAPLLLIAALAARDLTVDRRLHRATLWGGIVAQLVPIPLVAVVGFSGLGRAIVAALA